MAKDINQTFRLNVSQASQALNTLANRTQKYNEQVKALRTLTDQQARATAKVLNHLPNLAKELRTAATQTGKLNTHLAKNITNTREAATQAGRAARSLGALKGNASAANGAMRAAAGAAGRFVDKINAANQHMRTQNRHLGKAVGLFKDWTTEMRRAIAAMRTKNDMIDRQSRLHRRQNRDVQRGTRNLYDFIISWQLAARVLAVTAIHRWALRLAQAIIYARREAEELTIRIGEIQTIQGESGKSADEWRKSLVGVSLAFGVNTVEAAEAAYQALSNQITDAGSSALFLRHQVRLAVSAVTTLDTATSATTAILNAWGYEVNKTTTVNQLLFATVERGRLRLEDIANTIGRVSILSKQLGISVAEQEASIALLTRSGISAEAAMTLLRAVQLKLIRPTERMSEIFTEWGVTSGQAAIQAFGFLGVVDKLSKVAQEGGDELAELGESLGRVRAITGFAGLSAGNLRKEVDLLIDAASRYNEKFNLVFETTGKKLRTEFERAKTIIIDQFLIPFNEELVKFIEQLGGAQAIVSGFATVIVKSASYWVAYRAALTLAALWTNNVMRRSRALLIVLAALRGRWSVITTAIRRYHVAQSGALLGLTLLIGALVESELAWLNAGIAAQAAGAEARAAIEQMTAPALEKQLERISLAFVRLNENITNTFREFFNYIANTKAALSGFEIDSKKKFEAIGKSIKKSLQDPLKAIEEAIRATRAEVERIQKEAENRRQNVKERQLDNVEEVFRARLVGQDEIQQLVELNRLKIALNRRAQEEIAKDNVKEADLLFKKVEELQKEVIDRVREIREGAAKKEDVKQEIRQRVFDPLTGRLRTKTEQAVVGEREVDPQRAQQALQLLNALERERLNQVQERIRAEEAFIARQEQHARNLKEQTDAREKALENFRQKLANLDAFDFTQEGAVDKFQAAVRQADAAAGAAGLDPQARIELLRNAQAQEILLRRETAIKAGQQELLVAKKTVDSLDKLFKEAAENQEAVIAKRAEIIKGTAIPQFAEIAGLLENFQKRVAAATESAGAAPAEGFVTDETIASQQAAVQLKLFASQLKQIQDLLYRFPRVASEKQKVDIANKLTSAYTELIKQLEVLNKLEGIRETRGLVFSVQARREKDGGLAIAPGKESVNDVVKRLTETLKLIGQSNESFDQATQNTRQLLIQLEGAQKIAARIPDEFKKTAEEAANATAAQILQQQNVVKALDQVIQRLERVRQLNGKLANPGAVPPGFAHGGKVRHFAFGGGQGTDRIPAYLSRGEIVNTQLASNQFAPLLHALNAAGPIGRQGNLGGVSFGDITINVPQGTSEEQLDTIVRGLRRRARQGLLNI